MLTIPAAVETLLKSKVMVGENRPTAIVEVAGQPVTTGELIDPTNWTTWQQQGAADWMQSYGNCASNKEGTPIMVYRPGDSSTVKIAFGTNWPAILSGTEDFNFAGALTITTTKYRAICRVSLIEGELHLAICWWDATTYKAILEYWKDSTGIGSSFAYVSTINGDVAWNFFNYGNTPGVDDPTSATTTWNMISEIKKLTNGTLIIVTNEPNFSYNYIVACYSTDNGLTWNIGERNGYQYGRSFTSGVIEFDDGNFGVFVTYSSGTKRLFYWTPTGVINYVGISNWLYGAIASKTTCCRSGNEVYLATYGFKDSDTITHIYHYTGVLPLTPTLCADGDNWELIKEMSASPANDTGARHISFCDEYLILSLDATVGTNNKGYFILAGCEGELTHIPVKSVTVDRSKGSASMATVMIDNKSGQYSPDSTGEWNKIIWLNKQITIKLGYGAEQQLVFTGLIDEITETNYPAELTIIARDMAKRALDQQPQAIVGEATVYALLYETKTPEEIFAELALLAGWAAEDIHIGITGVTISSIQFGHESIADCFQRLCELVCWEWFVDEAGDIYFQASTDPAAATVYEFIEGIDIFSISYRISDIDLYRNIVVWTSDEDGLAVKATEAWSAADYNNLLPYKTLIIPASDLVTDAAGCAAIAAAEANAITPKVREVNFVVVGNPYLQIGDVVKVTESTTHASELYRIMELMHQQEAAAEGVPVFSTSIRCYHYGPA